LHGLANLAFLDGFLCSGLQAIAPYCAPSGVKVVSRVCAVKGKSRRKFVNAVHTSCAVRRTR
jgi:hypothetical protein